MPEPGDRVGMGQQVEQIAAAGRRDGPDDQPVRRPLACPRAVRSHGSQLYVAPGVTARPAGRAPGADGPEAGGPEAGGPEAGRLRLGHLVGVIAARPASWRDIVRFDASRRWYRRLELTDDHEVWLLSWLPGQSTGFHDHGGAAGAFAVAQGELRERMVPAGQVRASGRTLPAGQVRTFGAGHVHDVVNIWTEPAVSVHAYSPPLTAMRRYELTAGGLVRSDIEYSELNW